jgi:predicted ATPase
LEIEDVENLLRDHGVRLLTLTGPGGVGKTRLAIQAARDTAELFPDGVVFAALASTGGMTLIPTLVRILGLSDTGPRAPREVLVEYLRDLRLLLVLDNLEHLLEAAPEIADLIEACPDFAVLATSRAPLRIRGEQEYPVPPLALPLSTNSPTAEVALSPSVRLFAERAAAVSQTFTLNDGNAPTIASICWRLGGLPLAIELAAARSRYLDPTTLLSRLDKALSVSWARDVPERQRTMRATLDWSYDLLSAPEQALFRRLSVFAGGFELEAAEAVGATQDTPADEVVELLGGLVEHSLVMSGQEKVGDEPRYGMLEPVRQYAREKLEACDEAAETTKRHAVYFLRKAESARPELLGAGQVGWFEALDADHDNFRAAIELALSIGEAENAARMGWALWPFWRIRGHQQEGRQWMERTLQLDLPAYWQGRAANVARAMAYAQGDYEACERYARQTLDLSVRTGDEALEGYSWIGLGLVALTREDFASAASSMERAYPLLDRSNERGMASMARVWLGTARLAGGDAEGAIPMFREGAVLARKVGDRVGLYVALYNLAQVALARGDHEEAATLLREGVALSEELVDRANLSYFLEGLAAVASLRGEPEHAAKLSGAAEGLLHEAGARVYNYYRPDRSLYERTTVAARQGIGEEAFERARSEGRNLAFEDAVAFALTTA